MIPRPLAADLWYWTAPHPDWRPAHGGDGGWDQVVGSWLVAADERAVLIDPLVPDDGALLRWLDDRLAGRDVHVLVTVSWHLRSAVAIRDRYGATVWGNAKTRLDVGTLVAKIVTDGAELPGGIVPFTPIPNDAGDDETAYWLPRQRALAVGDILINTRDGLRIWWDEKTEALRSELRDRAKPALLRLAALPIELILVPHGEPVVRDGKQALRRALDADPWQRPRVGTD